MYAGRNTDRSSLRLSVVAVKYSTLWCGFTSRNMDNNPIPKVVAERTKALADRSEQITLQHYKSHFMAFGTVLIAEPWQTGFIHVSLVQGFCCQRRHTWALHRNSTWRQTSPHSRTFWVGCWKMCAEKKEDCGFWPEYLSEGKTS